MPSMVFSFVIGTAVYILAQFLWYAPFAFGPLWSRYGKGAPESESPVLLPVCVPQSIRGIILPAILISLTLHVLHIMLSHSDTVGFLSGVLTLWFFVVLPKYVRRNINTAQRQKWYIEDGALLWSLLWVSASILLGWGNIL